MASHSFILNGKRVKVDCENDTRLLWVIRDLLGVRGPKYGCGINVCKACTCHINGRAFNPCSVPISKIKRSDRITTIEGLPQTVGKKLHPMQKAWLELDVAQCGYCQPGQVMQAVSLVNEVRRKEGRRKITDRDIESIRNVCRCGTYPRIREAIKAGAADMPMPKRRKRKTKRARPSEADAAPAARPSAAATAAPSAAPSPAAPAPAAPTPPPVTPNTPPVDLGVIKVGGA